MALLLVVYQPATELLSEAWALPSQELGAETPGRAGSTGRMGRLPPWPRARDLVSGTLPALQPATVWPGSCSAHSWRVLAVCLAFGFLVPKMGRRSPGRAVVRLGWPGRRHHKRSRHHLMRPGHRLHPEGRSAPGARGSERTGVAPAGSHPVRDYQASPSGGHPDSPPHHTEHYRAGPSKGARGSRGPAP